MTDDWVFAINAEDVDDEDVAPIEIEGEEIAIYRNNGQYYASVDKCTHGDAFLSDGIVVGDVIECPLHQGRFCIKTGKALSAPVSVPIETFEVKVEDGKVFVKLGQTK